MAVSAGLQREYLRLREAFVERHFDLIGPVCMFILALFGVLFIRSAQLYTGGTQWQMQIVWVVVGFGAYVAVSSFHYRRLLDQGHWVYAAGIALLLLVWTPLGTEMFGARRWINLGFMRLQPVEFAKVATLIFTAGILARSRVGTVSESMTTLVKFSVAFAIPILLIFIQPDLGSSLVFPPMAFALLYVSKLSSRFFITVFALLLLAVAVIGFDVYRYYQHTYGVQETVVEERGSYEERRILPLRNYQRDRILTFVAPDLVDPRGTGNSWNLWQSKISVGLGGAFGQGFGQSTQARLGYLPSGVAHNDFIFAVLAEETGFIGSVFVIGLFSLLIVNGIRIAGMAGDRFGMYLAVGVSVIFLVHLFINVGMTMGITPITGLPLPFLSYGGSFMLGCCILQGLVQSVYRYRRDFA